MGTIVLKHIDMTLDVASIENAIKQVRELEHDIKSALDGLCEYLLEYGVTVARMNLMRLTSMRSGKLYGSIRHGAFDRTKGIGYLMAGYPGDHEYEGSGYESISYAVFIEFGFGGSQAYRDDTGTTWMADTGKKGLSHVLTKKVGYKSNINKRRIATKDSSVPGWIYMNRHDGKFYFSQGQPPKPFMYNTLLDLSEFAERDGGRIVAQYIP